MDQGQSSGIDVLLGDYPAFLIDSVQSMVDLGTAMVFMMPVIITGSRIGHSKCSSYLRFAEFGN